MRYRLVRKIPQSSWPQVSGDAQIVIRSMTFVFNPATPLNLPPSYKWRCYKKKKQDAANILENSHRKSRRLFSSIDTCTMITKLRQKQVCKGVGDFSASGGKLLTEHRRH